MTGDLSTLNRRSFAFGGLAAFAACIVHIEPTVAEHQKNVPVPPPDFVMTLKMKDDVAEILSRLTEREYQVLAMRLGLEDGRTRTLEEVGQAFGFSRERARQIEASALRKLRQPSRDKSGA
jgi:RNA polymerase primary sigma factor